MIDTNWGLMLERTFYKHMDIRCHHGIPKEESQTKVTEDLTGKLAKIYQN